MARRAAIIVLDGLGIGEARDAAAYGDTGSNTLGNVASAAGGLALPHLERMGLGCCAPVAGISPHVTATCAWGTAEPASAGKDSTTGHWEIALLVADTARELRAQGTIPFAAFCSDPCDGRTQGTTGMFDSLPYRNDAAQVFRRLIRSLPTRHAVIGVATCDKGLPAMLMALAGTTDLPCVLVPGGVTLPSLSGEDAGRVQTIGVRFAHGELTMEQAAELGCRACGSPGGGCQFLGTAATSQVIGEALGLSLGHSALAPSGQPIWLDMASRSAQALLALEASGL